MTIRANFLVLLLLAGCTSNAKYLALAETAGDYPGIDKKAWVYTVYGFYLSRDTQVDGNTVTYQALFDNREAKAQMMRQYATTERFKTQYPEFVLNKGTVDCGSKKSEAIAVRLDAALKPIGTMNLQDTQELAGALCVMKDLIH